MAIDLSKKRIFMIHGLASKPPETALHELWSNCLIENIRLDDAPLARAIEGQPSILRHAYWANKIPHHIEDDRRYVRRLRGQVDEVIEARQKMGGDFHVGTRQKIGAFFKDRGLDLVNVFANALTIKDNVAKAMLREVELYSDDQYIADSIRRPLEEGLRGAWDDGCEVLLISHSMGSFIAYDVLWRFSHRNVDEFRKYRNKRVRMFVTIGSPLGDGVVRELLFAHHHRKAGARHFPTNIDYWHNYACLGDVVSHEHDFKEAFFEPMAKEKLFPKRIGHRAKNYDNLYNPFTVVTHKGNRTKEKRNPHKSYGYLVQPRLGTWVADFLRGRVKA